MISNTSVHTEFKVKALTVFVLCVLCVCFHLSASSQNTTTDYIISKQIDLKGDTLKLPKGVRLFFKSGACIKNGIIKGNENSIGGNTKNAFENIEISGAWNVAFIPSSMFADIHKDNVLKHLFAFASPDVKNIIQIETGEYWLEATNDWQILLQVPTNTEVLLKGTINLRPNRWKGYKMINLEGDDITLHGRGSIIGEKKNHLGKDGEWGMGVNIYGGRNISVSRITVKDCWGDCIYVGGKATDVRISNCFLEGSRRQGISVTSAGKVFIANCTIKNIAGTAPEYAIDIEPNSGDTVEYVSIRNVKAIDCGGGFMSWHPKKNSKIASIEILNCSVEGNLKHYSYSFERTGSLIMRNNQGIGKQIRLIDLQNAILDNNSIKGQWFSDYMIRNCNNVITK